MLSFCGKHIHFIGIGGVGVNALAKFAIDMGASVSGSDCVINKLCVDVENRGATVWQGENPDMMKNADIVVYSSAIANDNKELCMAHSSKAEVFERYEFLGAVSRLFGNVVAIAGTHGKTTTTAMLTHILKMSGKNFVAMIGGECVNYSNYVNNIYDNESHIASDKIEQNGFGADNAESSELQTKKLANLKNAILLCEACEYKKSLLALNPDIAVVTNVECDHPDCYENIESLTGVFRQFFSQSKVCITDVKHMDILPKFNFERKPIVQDECFDSAKTLCIFKDEKVSECKFDIIFEDDKCVGMRSVGCQCRLKDDGIYNYINAVFAISTAVQIGICESESAKYLQSFLGVKRRFERANDICGVPTFFDFAHHPTEINCVVQRAKSFGRILLVFQPHTYSRTKAYLEDFAKVLSQNSITTLVLMPTYPARESKNMGVDSDVLYDEICRIMRCEKNGKIRQNDVYLAHSHKSTIDYVKKCAFGHDVILFVGAGDIYALKQQF